MKNIATLLLVILTTIIYAQEPFEKNESYTYEQLQVVYKSLAKEYPSSSKLIQFGESDYGENIQLFMISKNGVFNPEALKNKTILIMAIL